MSQKDKEELFPQRVAHVMKSDWNWKLGKREIFIKKKKKNKYKKFYVLHERTKKE